MKLLNQLPRGAGPPAGPKVLPRTSLVEFADLMEEELLKGLYFLVVLILKQRKLSASQVENEAC